MSEAVFVKNVKVCVACESRGVEKRRRVELVLEVVLVLKGAIRTSKGRSLILTCTRTLTAKAVSKNTMTTTPVFSCGDT